MKKTIAVLMLLVFGFSQSVFAAGAVLSDSEMDDINAGSWVIIADAEGNEEVVDVYHNNNDIKLNDESQMELRAVNQANAVDSAIASQANIARVTQETPVANTNINHHNQADILNYNPSESGSERKLVSFEETFSFSASENCQINSNETASAAASFASSFAEILTWDETLDIVHSKASATEEEGKGFENETMSAEAFLLDYDKDIDYNKTKSASASASASAAKTFSLSKESTVNESGSRIAICEEESSYRNNLSENNHIDLEDTSQRLLMAVSNLNAVGSGAAMQANIASNVGVDGSINQLNVATVVNGL
jgi:hypothetical protein